MNASAPAVNRYDLATWAVSALALLLEREGGAALSRTAGEAMNAHPRTIASSEFAATALAILEERKITSLVVVGAEQKVEGVVHLHDLWGVELI